MMFRMNRNLLILFLLSFLINCSSSYLRASFFSRSRSIDTKECIANKLKGQCMFSFECMQHKGKSIGICIEQYYVGSCCYFNSSDVDDELQIINNDKQQSKPMPLVSDFDNDRMPSSISQQSVLSSNAPNENVLVNKRVTSNHQTDTTTASSTRLNSIGFYSSQTSNNKLLGNKQNLTETPTTSVENENDTSNSNDKTNYLKQKKPINLIDHQEAEATTAVVDTKDMIKVFLNQLMHTNVVASHTTIMASSLEPSINNSLDANKIIDKNLNDSHLISDPSIDLIKSSTTLSPLNTLSTQLPIEKYFMNQECGLQPDASYARSKRVLGGRNSKPAEFPWQVQIKESSWFGYLVKNKCGGVLIHPKYILTSSHCSPQFFGSLFVILGQHNLNKNEPKPVIRQVKRMIIHRDYNPHTFENDIAILELITPIENQPGITPICLPTLESDTFEEATVTGFGKVQYGGSVPTVLQVAKLPILDNKKCQEMYLSMGIIKKIRDTFLCAGFKQNSDTTQITSDSCEGDSGSPLISRRENGQWVLLGTVSHGIKCGFLPGIYMRTKSYLNWIYNTIQYSSMENSSKKIVQRFRYQ